MRCLNRNMGLFCAMVFSCSQMQWDVLTILLKPFIISFLCTIYDLFFTEHVALSINFLQLLYVRTYIRTCGPNFKLNELPGYLNN